MSRGVGPSGDGQVWCDGYSFQGEGVAKDPRHAHGAIHPKFRSAAADLRRGLGGFGWTSGLDATPMDPAARKRGATARGGAKGPSAKGPSARKLGAQLPGGTRKVKEGCAASAPAPEPGSAPGPGP